MVRTVDLPTSEATFAPTWFSSPHMGDWESALNVVGASVTQQEYIPLPITTDGPVGVYYDSFPGPSGDATYAEVDLDQLEIVSLGVPGVSGGQAIQVDLLGPVSTVTTGTLIGVEVLLRYRANHPLTAIMLVGNATATPGDWRPYVRSEDMGTAFGITLPDTAGVWTDVTLTYPTTHTDVLLMTRGDRSFVNIVPDAGVVATGLWAIAHATIRLLIDPGIPLPLRQRQRRDGLKSAGRGRQASSRQATNRGRGYW